MNAQEANKVVKQVEAICEQNKPDIWRKVIYDNKPDLKFINIEMTIKLNPAYTRKLEK